MPDPLANQSSKFQSPDPQPTRRSFAKSIAITIGTILIGTAWVFREWYHRRLTPAAVIAHADEISVGASKIFQYPTDVAPCILIRTAESAYVAYSRICTHNSCPLFYRPDESALECRCHGGLFSIADGSVLAGPPLRPLPRIQLEIRGSNIVAVGITST